jgi:hypothetical protein
MTSAWIGIRGSSRAEVCARLGLTDAKRPADRELDELAIAELPNGWTIVRSLKFSYPSQKRLAKLSRGVEAVAVLVQVSVGVSGAEFWRDGRLVWSVTHQLWNSLYDLETKGEPPAALTAIHEQQRRQQDEAGGLAASDDYLLIVPLLLGREICGYFPEEPPLPNFTALDPRRSGLFAMLGRSRRP